MILDFSNSKGEVGAQSETSFTVQSMLILVSESGKDRIGDSARKRTNKVKGALLFIDECRGVREEWWVRGAGNTLHDLERMVGMPYRRQLPSLPRTALSKHQEKIVTSHREEPVDAGGLCSVCHLA